ncbi:MAG: hypothetical protein R3244_10985 [Thermoanaerobaculia bacterium]|nr:hypothetical protein [Thermoanaerobaculia bacterium]
MEAWWATLNEPLKWFYTIAITTSVLMVFQLILMLFGMDGDEFDDVDADGDGAGAEVKVLSIRTVTAFFAGFGWTGVAVLESGGGLVAALGAAALIGGVFMGGVILLMRGLSAMRHSGTLDYANAIGEVGTVYLRIPPAMSNPGQVEIMVQGRLMVAQAFTRADSEIPNQTRVRVTEVMDKNTLVVEPLAGAESSGEES